MKITFVAEFGRENHKAAAKIVDKKSITNWDDIFTSGYVESEFPTGDPDEMKYCGKYYSFGNRMAVEKDVLDSDRMKICFLYSLCKYAEDAKIPDTEDLETILGVTAPIDVHGKEQLRYAAYFESINVMCEYHGVNRFISVSKCISFPEGQIAFFPYQKNCKETDVLVIEIGSRTMNVAEFHKDNHSKRWIPQKAFTKNVGCLIMLHAVRDELRKEGITVSEKQVEDVVYGVDISHSHLDRIKEVTNRVVNLYINQKILGSLIEENVVTEVPVLLGGGTGDMLYSRLGQELNVITNAGVFANARGAYAALELVAKRFK